MFNTKSNNSSPNIKGKDNNIHYKTNNANNTKLNIKGINYKSSKLDCKNIKYKISSHLQ